MPPWSCMFQLNFISEAQIAHVLMLFWSWWLIVLQHGSRFLDVLPSRFQAICQQCQQFVHHLTLEASQVSQEVFHLAAMTYCNEAIWPKSRATKSNSQKIRWKYLKHPKTTLRNIKFTLDIVYLVFTLVSLWNHTNFCTSAFFGIYPKPFPASANMSAPVKNVYNVYFSHIYHYVILTWDEFHPQQSISTSTPLEQIYTN